MTSLTVVSVAGAILGSYLLKRAKLRGDCHWQIARDDSQRTVLLRHPLGGAATNIHRQSRRIRAAQALRQEPSDRSGQNITAPRGCERRGSVNGDCSSV